VGTPHWESWGFHIGSRGDSTLGVRQGDYMLGDDKQVQDQRSLKEECRILGYKNPVRTSQETHYVLARAQPVNAM
jgi:hypothetical protein